MVCNNMNNLIPHKNHKIIYLYIYTNTIMQLHRNKGLEHHKLNE